MVTQLTAATLFVFNIDEGLVYKKLVPFYLLADFIYESSWGSLSDMSSMVCSSFTVLASYGTFSDEV